MASANRHLHPLRGTNTVSDYPTIEVDGVVYGPAQIRVLCTLLAQRDQEQADTLREAVKVEEDRNALLRSMQDIHARSSAVLNNGFPDEAPEALAGICKAACDALKAHNAVGAETTITPPRGERII